MRHGFLYQLRAVTLAGCSLLACARSAHQPVTAQARVPPDGAGLVLQADEGERRVRRNAGKGPFILKVDRQNGGSPDLVMGYEDIAPGDLPNVPLGKRQQMANAIVLIGAGSIGQAIAR